MMNSSEARRHVEPLAFSEGHICLLGIAEPRRPALEALDLALAHQRIDGLDLDTEQAFDRRLDLGLCRRPADIEEDLIVLGNLGSLFGDRRTANDVVEMFLGHLNRASSASMAALVQTSFLRRSMS